MQRLLALLLMLPIGLAHSAPVCDVESGPSRRVLIELFTSEGCSSCPPADKRLSQIPDDTLPADKAIALALHVDYWDYIGWKDPYARSAFGERHHWLVHANHHFTFYTPHFFVSGTEVPDWRNDLVAEAERINRLPPRAGIRLRVAGSKPAVLNLDTVASSPDTSLPLGLFIAVTEDRLASNVRQGENAGATLHHDHVVREWIGPLALTAGKVKDHRALLLDSRWDRQQLGVVAFVQNVNSGEVLQALSAGHCLDAAIPGK